MFTVRLLHSVYTVRAHIQLHMRFDFLNYLKINKMHKKHIFIVKKIRNYQKTSKKDNKN